MKLGLLFIFIIIGTLCSVPIFGKSLRDDNLSREKYLKLCHENKNFLIKGKFKVECSKNYHHYNSDSKASFFSTFFKRKVRIGGFNILHPGMGKTRYKDYKILAKVINKFDVLGAYELVPNVSGDAKNNHAIVDFLTESGPQQLEFFKNYLEEVGENSKARETVGKEIRRLQSTIEEAKKLYRAPGYLKILDELRKLDSSWSLIISPLGDAAKAGQLHELVGFYYRGKVVSPKKNEHCKEFKIGSKGKNFACIANLYSNFMGKNLTNSFSRRPFIGSFKSGDFDFTLIASHVVYQSSRNLQDMKKILKPSFGVNHYERLQGSVNRGNYARFAEVKSTLDFMNKLKDRYKEKDLIWVSDMNLTLKESFLEEIRDEAYPEGEFFIHRPTSIRGSRFDAAGKETQGLSKNYDHFFFNPNETKECADSFDKQKIDIISFLSGDIFKNIAEKYFVSSSSGNRVGMTAKGRAKMLKHVKIYEKKLRSRKTIRNGKIVFDDTKLERSLNGFRERVFKQQMNNRTYYKVFIETISDHLPIGLSCNI